MINLRKLYTKPWFRCGIKGLVIGMLLFFFYIGIYLPILDQVYGRNPLPNWTITPMMITGHHYLIFAHFIIESSSLFDRFCPKEFYCYSRTAKWVVEEEGGDCSIPVDLEGQPGCCIGYDYGPTGECVEQVEKAGFLSIAFMLLLIYFVIGAVISAMIARFRHNQKSE